MKNTLLKLICKLIGHEAELSLGERTKPLQYTIKCARCEKMIMDTNSKEYKTEAMQVIAEDNWENDINSGKDQ